MAGLAAGDGERRDHVHDWTQDGATGIHTRQPVLYGDQLRQPTGVAERIPRRSQKTRMN